ncbi:MAG: AsmA family protein [Candidatus Rokubacteria bacterium]|nr:AsmA family protein [Candidatus Rokubacteria bacterium]
MKRLVIWGGAAVAAIVVLTIVAAVALPRLVDTPRVQSLIATQASQALGRPVSFSSVSASLFPLPSVILKDLKVAEDPRFGTSPFLALDRGELRLKLGALASGRIEFGGLVLKKPVIAIVQDGQGRWNFSTLGASTEPRAPSSKPRGGGVATAAAPLTGDVKLENGVVTFQTRGSARAAQSYRIENLDLAVDASGGRLAFKGAARVKPGDLQLKITDGTVTLNGGRSLMDAPIAAKIAIDGRQVKDLVGATLGPEPAIAGGLNGALTLSGTAASPRAAGDVTLSDVAITRTSAHCPDPKQRTLKLDTVKLKVGWEDGHLVARPVTTAIAKGPIATNLVATLESGTHVQLRDLRIRTLPIEKVLVDYLCQGYAVTGPLDLNGVLSFDARDLWGTLAGSGELKIGGGRVVGSQALALLGGVTRVGGAVSSLLAPDAPAIAPGSPLEFDAITATYTIAKGVVTTRDLLYASRALRMTVAGDYTLTSGRMNLDVVATQGRNEIHAKVAGTAAAPQIRVNPAATLRSVDPERARSGLEDLLRRFR